MLTNGNMRLPEINMPGSPGRSGEVNPGGAYSPSPRQHQRTMDAGGNWHSSAGDELV